MDAARAFGHAWRSVEPDLGRWVKAFRPNTFDPDATLRFAVIQAKFADALRTDLADLDIFVRERVVLSALARFREAMTTVGLVPPDVTMRQARQAVAASALRTATTQGDIQQRAERERRFAAMVAAQAVTWKWKAKLDTRTCLFCITRHGTIHPIGVPLESHPNCRCVPVPSDTPLVEGADWLRRRNPDTLRRMLGPSRATLVDRGVSIETLVDPSRHGPRPVRDFKDAFDGMNIDSNKPGPQRSTIMGMDAASEKRFRGKGKLGPLDEFALQPSASIGLHDEGLGERVTRTKFSRRIPTPEFHLELSELPDRAREDAEAFLNDYVPEVMRDLLRTFELGSTWNGRLDVIDPKNIPGLYGATGASATKMWNSSIYINAEGAIRGVGTLRSNRASAFWTLYHEFLHSFSHIAGTRQDFHRSTRWFEEGCIDLLTHTFGGELWESLGNDPALWEEVARGRESGTYHGAVLRLRKLADILWPDEEQNDLVLALAFIDEDIGDRASKVVTSIEEDVADPDQQIEAKQLVWELIHGTWIR